MNHLHANMRNPYSKSLNKRPLNRVYLANAALLASFQLIHNVKATFQLPLPDYCMVEQRDTATTDAFDKYGDVVEQDGR